MCEQPCLWCELWVMIKIGAAICIGMGIGVVIIGIGTRLYNMFGGE